MRRRRVALDTIACGCQITLIFFFSSRRRHTRFDCDWSSDVCSSDLTQARENGVVFIANNAVHEYVSQGNIHESLDLASVSSFRRASALAAVAKARAEIDRKSTRLNSSHSQISYAVFCLKKKKNRRTD